MMLLGMYYDLPMGGSFGWGWMWASAIFLGAVVLMMLGWLLRFGAYDHSEPMDSPPPRHEDSAEMILKKRYARGEIDDATYARMLEELRR